MKRFIMALMSSLLLPTIAQANQLAIVIDDVGYRPQEENALLLMPTAISIAILPNAPHAQQMALRAHQQGREVLIHLPMAPLSKQSLEQDTLQPTMNDAQIQRIIKNAVNKVPYAVGVNNHMGSAMTSNLPAMRKVMHALIPYRLYFLDSMTIGNSQVSKAAQGTGIKVVKRQVFLDDSANIADIRQQFDKAIAQARRFGFAIAIGHPRPATMQVLQQKLATLPGDITLVAPSALLNMPAQQLTTKTKPLADNTNKVAIAICNIELPKEAISAKQALIILIDSVSHSAVMQILQHHWQTLTSYFNNDADANEQ